MRNWQILGRLGSALLAAVLLSIPACGSMNSQPVSPGGTGGTLSERDIDTLPGWQQAQFTSPGWDAPAPPPEGAWLPAPELGQIGRETSALLATPPALAPRGYSGKSASWNDQATYVPPTPVATGEYEALAPYVTPPYGCNNNGGNSANGHAIEDVLPLAPYPMSAPQRISFVLHGLSQPNYFNATGGTGNDALSAVYQLFSWSRSADPMDENSPYEFAELSYRADLAPGVGPGGDCSAAEAFAVTGKFWRAFNRQFTLNGPEGKIALYNILIAPRGELSEILVNNMGTEARYQPFYFGSVPACFGGAWLAGLESSSGNCPEFVELIAKYSGGQDHTFVNPVLGVILKRWQQGAPLGDAAWNGLLGWPVFGPISYHRLAPQIDEEGVYRAIGMWFERGFIWWIDYDQALYPDAADKALTYLYAGPNVYSMQEPRLYVKLGTPLRYSDRGPLGVCVTAEDTLAQDDTVYSVDVDEPLLLHTHGYGGAPDAQWRYEYLTWDFGDGTVLPDTQAYVDDTETVEHSFSEPGTYTVTVRVTDSLGAEGFGSTLPVVVE